MNKILSVLCLCMLLFACNSQKAHEESIDLQYKGDTLCISEQSNILAKIKLSTVGSELYSAEFNTTGTVKAVPGQLAEIAPPFNGRVLKSFVRLGQRVSAGTPIFELSSPDFYEASKNYFQALQAKKMTEINFKRQKDLVSHGVGVQKELEEAESNYESAQNEYENMVAGLKMFNINPNELIMGQPLKVFSPIAGEVVQSNIVLGQFVKSDALPLTVVADLSKVWVVAQVKEKYIAAIHTEDKVEIRTDADPDHEIIGRVYHISELLDEETRSVQVLIACDNDNRKLKPGMFASVHFINAPKESIIIPSSALLQSESGTYLFIEAGKNKYLKRFVNSVTAKQDKVVITEGLQAGDVVVVDGGIYLMSNN